MINVHEKICRIISSYYQEVPAKLKDELYNFLNDYIQVFDDEENLAWISLEDVLFIDRDGNSSIFYLPNKKYKHAISYNMLLALTEKYDYQKSDNKILVNMNKVKGYDSKLGRVYFDRYQDLNESSFYAYISQRNLAKFKKRLGKEMDFSHEGESAATKMNVMLY